MNSHQNSKDNDNNTTTSSALLEQLVYIDNFISNGSGNTGDLTPNLDIDGQLSMDLAAFADDSFIFPDEEKPKDTPNNPNDDNDRNGSSNSDNNQSILDNIGTSNDHSPNINQHAHLPTTSINISNLPKFPVPPGAKSSLVSVGVSQNQIDLLSALIAQHQSSLGNLQLSSQASGNVSSIKNNNSISHNGDIQFNSPVRQHNQIQLDNKSLDQLLDLSTNIASGTNYNNTYMSPQNSIQPQNSSTTSTPQSTAIRTPSSNDETGLSTELDKRRRNTAASARFRIKKKMKEKQMETKIFHLNELIKNFEGKIQQLEMENKLLRNLIIEKGSQKSDNELKLLKERAKLN